MAAWFRSMLIEDESSGKKNGYDARAANQVVEATSGFGPSVWTGRALQAESDDLEKLVLRICIRPIHGAFELLAIMDIRACSRTRWRDLSPSPHFDSQTSVGKLTQLLFGGQLEPSVIPLVNLSVSRAAFVRRVS